MTTLTRLWLRVSTSILLAVSSTAATATELPGLDELVDRTMAQAIQHGTLAGAVVTVVKDGEVILLKGYGHADIEKRSSVDPEKTLFRIGSITKTFTWTALTQLIEQGKIGLDQPIRELLPPSVQPAPSPYDAQPILVRHLFTHSGGFEDKVLNHFFLRDPQQVRPLQEALVQYKPRRIRPPGVSATYSNYGAALAGAIVENVSGESYADYIDRHILTPLSMTSTTAREPLGPGKPQSLSAALTSQLARGYITVGGKLEPRPFEYVSQVGSAGSISSTGADMGRYMLAHLRPGAILSPESAARMQSRLFTNSPELPGIGYGWALDHIGTLPIVWHSGDTMAFHSMLMLVPAEHLGIFISTNASSSTPLTAELPRKILTTYFPTARVQPTPIPVAASTLKQYRGTFLGDRLSTSTAERFFVGLISGIREVRDTPQGLSINGSRLTAVRPDVFTGESGRSLVFQRDETGRVSGFTTSAESFHRLAPWQTPLALGVTAVLSVLLSLINLWSSRRSLRSDIPSRQKIALVLSLGASIGWLVFTGCLIAAFILLMKSPLDAVFTYPSAVLSIGLWVGVGTAALTVAAIAGTPTLMASSSWPKRIRYAASAIVWTVLLLMLHDWRLLGLDA